MKRIKKSAEPDGGGDNITKTIGDKGKILFVVWCVIVLIVISVGIWWRVGWK